MEMNELSIWQAWAQTRKERRRRWLEVYAQIVFCTIAFLCFSLMEGANA
jgi:hypothetical protein